MRLALSLSPDPEDLLFFSAITIEESTDSDLCRKPSRVARQEVMRWGRVPPITVSLVPRLSNMIPTSPIAPHCTARPNTVVGVVLVVVGLNSIEL